MEKQSKRRLDYTSGYKQEGGVTFPVPASKMVVCNYVKRYSNNMFLLAKLSPCARLLLDFLSENMSQDNVVHTNAVGRNEFITFVSYVTHGEVKFSDSTVKNSISQLRSHKLLFSASRGTMVVNPEYFFKGNEEERMRLVKVMYEANLVVPLPEDVVTAPAQPAIPTLPPSGPASSPALNQTVPPVARGVLRDSEGHEINEQGERLYGGRTASETIAYIESFK